jgi:hypothetical protein
MDCVLVSEGRICAGGDACLCPAGAINVAGQSRYIAQLDDLESRTSPSPSGIPCMCPYFGSPRCVAGQCVLCGGASGSAGCPDGG